MKINKTNVIRLLDKEKISYQLISYEVDENNLSATHVAKQLNEPAEQVFKTLVAKGDRTGYLVCIIPANKELDFKTVAKISNNKNCELIAMKDLLDITGYIRGACSPLGMKKQFLTFIDSSCKDLDYIYISSGKRGLQIQLDPKDLVRLGNFRIEDLTKM